MTAHDVYKINKLISEINSDQELVDFLGMEIYYPLRGFSKIETTLGVFKYVRYPNSFHIFHDEKEVSLKYLTNLLKRYTMLL